MHDEDDMDPDFRFEVPGGQAVHCIAPKDEEYDPGKHSVQSEGEDEAEFGFEVPNGHDEQAMDELDPMSEL